MENRIEGLALKGGVAGWNVWRRGIVPVVEGGNMEKLEQMAVAPLGLVERFQQELKAIIDDRALPVNEMMNRINHLREQIRQEGEGLCDAFDGEANELEKELLKKLEQLKEVRERAAVIRRVIGAMFRPA